MKNFFKIFLVIISLVSVSALSFAQAETFQQNPTKKEWRQRYKEEKKYKREVWKHQKNLNKDNLIGFEKQTYKRMKKTRKSSKRVNQNKRRVPFIKSVFRKKRY